MKNLEDPIGDRTREVPAYSSVPQPTALLLKRRELYESTRWFKYDRDCLCVNKPQFVPVIFEPPCNKMSNRLIKQTKFYRRLIKQTNKYIYTHILTMLTYSYLI
jgi:hypothetical protein